MPELAKPVLGPITSRYGWRVINGVSNFHNGLDYGWLYANVEGSRKVYSAHPGVVADVAYSAIAGNYILVDIGGGYQVRYIHLASTAVRAGRRVGYSTYLGVMGDTGSSTSQVHLHMDLFYGANRIDPEPHVTLPFGYTGPDYSGGGSEPIPVPTFLEDDMPVVVRRSTETLEWSLFHPSLRGATALERGYIVTTDAEVAKGWARIWANGFGNEKAEPRDVYIGMQDAARITHDAFVRSVPSASQNAQAVEARLADDFQRVIDAIPPASSGGGFTDADRARLQAVPTAEQNGAAARNAIVK